MRRLLRTRRYSPRTVEVYLGWVRRFIAFHGRRHPREMGEKDIATYLSALATESRVAAGTQNQALAAILFMYRHVLEMPMSVGRGVVRAKGPRRLPVVLTQDEVWRVLRELSGVEQLAALLMYGSGVRLMECLTLRVKDVDFGTREITVRDGKGQKDRRTILPASVVGDLETHLRRVRRVWERDRERGGRVALPDGLERKFPAASREWGWQWVAAIAAIPVVMIVNWLR